MLLPSRDRARSQTRAEASLANTSNMTYHDCSCHKASAIGCNRINWWYYHKPIMLTKLCQRSKPARDH